MKAKISVAIITKNEARNITRLLHSTKTFNEVVVVDSQSHDETLKIATSLGAKTITQEWLGYGKQKQFAVNACENDWIFSLDADEELSHDLVNELSDLDMSDDTRAFEIKRSSFFLGHKVRFSGWRNDYVVRIFNRKRAHFSDREVHEKVIGYTTLETLKGHLLHYPYQSHADIKRKTEIYSLLGAKELQKSRVQPMKAWVLRAKAFFSFVRTYVFQLGLLDGRAGLQIAMMNSKCTYLKYFKFNKLLLDSKHPATS